MTDYTYEQLKSALETASAGRITVAGNLDFGPSRGGRTSSRRLDSPRRSPVQRMAHARRYFFDVFDATTSLVAQEALSRIGALFAIEAEVKGAFGHGLARSRLADLLPWPGSA